MRAVAGRYPTTLKPSCFARITAVFTLAVDARQREAGGVRIA
jgi:hypothetical protein